MKQRTYLKVSEHAIEMYLKKEVEKLDGECVKFEFVGKGWPDRVCLFPKGLCVFVELKSPTGRCSAIQKVRIQWLRSHGYVATVINSRPRVDAMIKWAKEKLNER